MQTIRTLALIGTGGFIGTVCRYLLSKFVQGRFLSLFPFGTLTVNVIGCFCLGLIISFSEKANIHFERQLFLTTGICGGFTTFSAFSSEALGLMRDGHLWQAGAYILASVVLGILATLAGYSVLRIF